MQIDSVRRLVDEFAIQQLRADTWVLNGADRLRSYSEQIDNILTDESIGLSTHINSFFDSMQVAADDPTWSPNRQVVISEVDALSERFNGLYDRLADLRSAVNQELSLLVRDADSLAESIAELNLRVVSASGGGTLEQVSDLLDQRDQKILELSEIIDIRAIPDNGAINILLGKGQALVIGGLANGVISVANRFDASRLDVAVEIAGQPRVISNETTGGKIGGLLEFRDRVLDEAFASLGRVALGIAVDVNRQHQQGMDLNDQLGGLVFTDQNDSVLSALRSRAANDNDPTSTGVVRVLINDPSVLQTTTYQLDILAGGAWQLIRNSDTSLVASGPALIDNLVTIDGFTLDLNLTDIPPGNFVVGDSFLIEPTHRGAASIGRQIERPEELALAQPVRANAQLGNIGNGTVIGSNTFDVSTPLFATPTQLSPPLEIRFTSATTFDVLDANTAALIVGGLPYTPGVSNTLFSINSIDPDYFGFQVTISGDPVAGDSFRIDYNNGGSSDNRNGLALAKLQIADSLVNGSTNYQGAYGQLVSFIGSETRQARINTEAGEAALAQTKKTRDEVSGVNLDEEAANLIRFEQAYNASAQVISVARSLIDSLLDAFG